MFGFIAANFSSSYAICASLDENAAYVMAICCFTFSGSYSIKIGVINSYLPIN